MREKPENVRDSYFLFFSYISSSLPPSAVCKKAAKIIGLGTRRLEKATNTKIDSQSWNKTR